MMLNGGLVAEGFIEGAGLVAEGFIEGAGLIAESVKTIMLGSIS